jgi:spermidine/putrescine transport system permease protein
MSYDSSEGSRRERLLARLSGPKARVAITVGPGAVWLAMLMLAPLLFLVAVSFTVTDATYQIVWQATLDNYVSLLSSDGTRPFWEEPFVRSLALSYFIGAVTTVTTLIATFPVAYLLARRGGRLFKVMIYLVLLPFFTVYIVRAYSWLLMFGAGGNLNRLLLASGIVSEPLAAFDYGVAPIIVGLTHAYFPYMLLTLYASLDGVDFTLTEAARDLGAGRLEAFRDVVLPLVVPGIVSGTVFVFVPAIGAFLTPEFLAQGKVLMIGQLIAQRVNDIYAVGYGSAASMFIIASVVAAFTLAFRYVELQDLGGA